MPRFKYIARDSSGKRVAQTMEAPNKEEVLNNLKRENLTVVSVAEDSGGPPKKQPTISVPGEKKSLFKMSFGAVKPKVNGEMLVIFTRQFSTMIGAGIPVLECLTILQEQA